jgi:hypothetical protein
VEVRRLYQLIAIVGSLTFLIAVGPSFAEDLALRDCSELLRIAKTYEEDLKTVDTVLGSAIDAGNMDRIRTYRLKRAEIKRKLSSVLRVIDLKECTVAR